MHPISRTSKIKSQANAGLAEKLSPFAIKPAIKVARAHSLAESKKTPKLMMKSSKHPRSRLEIDTFLRLSKTPTPPPSASSQVTDNKSQEINQLNKEIQILKSELGKANEMIESLKKCSKCESLSSLELKSQQNQFLLTDLIHKTLLSQEVSYNFKQEVLSLLQPVKDEPWVLSLQSLTNPVEPPQSVIILPIPSVHSSFSQQDTARFHSMRNSSACNPSYLGQGIMMEEFKDESFWLHTGDRVNLVKKPNEAEWEVEHQGSVCKIPSSLIFID